MSNEPCAKHPSQDCLLNWLETDQSSPGKVCGGCRRTIEEIDVATNQLLTPLRKNACEEVLRDLPVLAVIQRQAIADRHRKEMQVPETIGAYDVGDLLGAGGMGAVYRAHHRKLRKDVAIKVLPSYAAHNEPVQARFEREMAAVGQLEHPNVVRALDAGDADGTSFLVMELIEGADIGKLVAEGRKLNVADACEIIRQTALGLQYAHDQGIIHRDVKPSNLILTKDANNVPVVKVLDLGLALLTQSSDPTQLTDQGHLMGTLGFMAPEQALQSHVDERADIYALGATLFRLLTGHVLFDGEQYNTPARRLYVLTNEAAPSISSRRPKLPVELVRLVDRMLARKPEDRVPSMREVVRILGALTSGHNVISLLSENGKSARHDAGRETVHTSVALADTSPTAPPVDKPATAQEPPTKKFQWWQSWGGVLAIVAMASAVFGMTWLKTTDGGYIRIETDPSVDISIDVICDGNLTKTIWVDRRGGNYWFASGEYRIRMPVDATDLAISGEEFTMTRNAEHTVRIKPVVANIPVNASPLLVTSANDNGPGSLRSAIGVAEDGDTIRFHDDLADKTIVLAGRQLHIESNVRIDAGSLAAPVTIDAAGLSRVLECTEACKVELVNLVLTGGNATENPRGGGILSGGELQLTNVLVTRNSAGDTGGGIKILESGRLTMVDCEISSNNAPAGAGIYTSGESTTITNCTICDNESVGHSAAYYQHNGTTTMVNTTITGNTATEVPAVTITQSSHARFRNVTITNNIASTISPTYAMTVYNGSRVELENCAIAGNGYPTSYDVEVVIGDTQFVTSGRNVIGTFRSEFGHRLDESVITSTDGIWLDPRVAKLGQYGGTIRTMPPLPGSPLVDSAVATVPLVSRDARGFSRPETASDIGAAEYVEEHDVALETSVPIPNVTQPPLAGPKETLRRLRIDHVFIRNDESPTTLQSSACRIIPFVTYSPLPKDAPERVKAQQAWGAKQKAGWNGKGYQLPEWMEDPRRIPLPMTGPIQKPAPLECPEGNTWLNAQFDKKIMVIDLYDDPITEDVDESTEVGFLIISHFKADRDGSAWHEFKKLSDLKFSPHSSQKRELYTPEIRDFRNLLSGSDRTYGLRSGKGEFIHYFTLEFIDVQ